MSQTNLTVVIYWVWGQDKTEKKLPMALFVGHDDTNNAKGWRPRPRLLSEGTIVMILWRPETGTIHT